LLRNHFCYFIEFKTDEVDVAQTLPSLQPVNEENTSNIFEILSQMTPGQIYEHMDHASRVDIISMNNNQGFIIILDS
jgi:hypothetical protein